MAALPPPESPEEKKEEKGKKPKTEKEKVEFQRDLSIIGLCILGILIFGSIAINQWNSLKESPQSSSAVQGQQRAVRTTIPTPTATPSVSREESLEKEIVEVVNYQRTLSEIKPLEIDPVLSAIAAFRSEDMARKNYFSHEPPDGCNWSCLLGKFGYPACYSAENVAWNNYPRNETVEVAMDGFMESPGHKENILNSHYEKIGVGVVKIDNKYYYTQIFGGDFYC